MNILTEIIEALFPSNIYCIGCGAIIDRSRPYALCDMCISEYRFVLGRTCSKCGKLLAKNNIHDLCHDCSGKHRAFYKGYCCLVYGSKEKAPILALKYGDKPYIGKKLGELLYDRLIPEQLEIECVVPVPLSRKRKAKRGYNQAEIIAKEVARRMKLPCIQALRRNKDTKPMSDLTISEREENLQNVFTISPRFSKMIKGGSILLIDDIFTTGSTADACALTMCEAGARRVYFASVAAGADITIEN
ncbi:MAG: ComF family protein [Eubacteriales bacterium]|nr:ComF family protein [Eubacteriales bacterium]MDD4389584.1 ComF family protein [Eubacteriales bacterium]